MAISPVSMACGFFHAAIVVGGRRGGCKNQAYIHEGENKELKNKIGKPRKEKERVRKCEENVKRGERKRKGRKEGRRKKRTSKEKKRYLGK